MKLNATRVKNTKPEPKPYKLFDGGGLFLLVQPTGSKLWRMKYRFGGKEKLLSLGAYPDLSLADARDAREANRKLLAKGVDPALEKSKARLRAAGRETFESVAREWHERTKPKWTPKHAARLLSALKRDIFPHLGSRPVDEIEPPEVLAVVRRVESRGAGEAAHRLLADCSRVFRYALASGKAKRNPAADLKGALAPVVVTHHASVTDPKEVGALLRAIDGYTGHHVTLCALKLAPLVFVRPGELRQAEWSEIDLEGAEWRIPAERMKAREPHIVPMSRQAVAVLRELYPLTGPQGYVFPSIRSKARPMSENTVNAALRRLGYGTDEMTGHGFRSMASTLLNEQGWNRDAIERQLAHAERNQVRAAYNYAEHLPERRKMMQAWADYLDALREGGKVVPFRRTGNGD